MTRDQYVVGWHEEMGTLLDSLRGKGQDVSAFEPYLSYLSDLRYDGEMVTDQQWATASAYIREVRAAAGVSVSDVADDINGARALAWGAGGLAVLLLLWGLTR